MAVTKALDLGELEEMDISRLHQVASDLDVSDVTGLKKQELIFRLLQSQAEHQATISASGVLEIVDDGFGFLRQQKFLPGPNDVYVSTSQIRRFGLRTGDLVYGQVRPPKDSEKFFSLLRVESANGVDPDSAKLRPHFDELTPIYPDEMFRLETGPDSISGRLMDLVAPIGKGQRGLIVAPPKAGKTILLQHIANGVSNNYPEAYLMIVLVGERPEEVTDMERNVNGEVLSSTFDEPTENHVHLAEMSLERAKRLVETGADVVVLLDSITRLARAYNLAMPPSGRTLSGGLDPVALYPPKRFFGAARNIEGGGSLTIVGTTLVDTGSRMDEVIDEEFKGTGNQELTLDRKLQERRIFPAIDIQRSGTRREELLLEPWILQKVWTMRRMLSAVGSVEGTELLLNRLNKSPNNREFLESLNPNGA
jgi:transcription termination factor Rho